MAGHLAEMLHGVPHVVTAHSLEPLRPWKAEQLGGGYRLSSWVERTAYESADAVIAVSDGMRADVLDAYPALDPDRVHVVHNGIDTELLPARPARATRCSPTASTRTGRASCSSGRITRQKGVGPPHRGRPPDRPRSADRAVRRRAGHPRDRRGDRAGGRRADARPARGVVWVRGMLPTTAVRQVLSAATVFVCPSVYEPLGIVNLEAMACATAVVASDVGGIPEVVDDGGPACWCTSTSTAVEEFRTGLADCGQRAGRRPRARAGDGRAGRERAEREFAWETAATRTVEIYRSLV